MKTITTTKTVYKYDELPEESKEKVLEKHYDINVDYEWWDYDGKTGFSAKEITRYHLQGFKECDLLEYKKLYFDLDRGQYIQFVDAEFTNTELARRFLGVPRPLWDRVDWRINDCPSRDGNTRLEYESSDYREFTPKQTAILERAVERFSDKIHEAWSDLRKQYEYLMTREAIEETIRCNEYDFDLNGNIC